MHGRNQDDSRGDPSTMLMLSRSQMKKQNFEANTVEAKMENIKGKSLAW